MHNDTCETAQGLGQALTERSLIDNPKLIEINTVENGFTVNLRGGKEVKDVPYKHHRLHVAQNEEEALQIAKDHLAQEQEILST